MQADDSSISQELFLKWRSPRFGSFNPEVMTNPVWSWLVKTRLSAYQANERHNGPPDVKAGPGWCFQRMGQSSSKLGDGRVILIAGEHEDSYDSDFYIYNDVVVQHPNGDAKIFGYPRNVFQPTDFHSATLIGNRILVIGCLGYPEDRKPGTTPVYSLDLSTFAISSVETFGTAPGWIYEHHALLSNDGASIMVQGGMLDRGEAEKTLVENLNDWRLCLTNWKWERLTERRWLRWEVRRKDHRIIHLWQYERALWEKKFRKSKQTMEEFAETPPARFPTLEEELGSTPDFELFERLYRPPLAHEVVPDNEDEYGVCRIRIAGVVVRYVQNTHCIQITVEGALPEQTLDSLTQDLLDKMSKLENSTCKLIQL